MHRILQDGEENAWTEKQCAHARGASKECLRPRLFAIAPLTFDLSHPPDFRLLVLHETE